MERALQKYGITAKAYGVVPDCVTVSFVQIPYDVIP